MKTARSVRTLAATITIIGSLAGGAMAGLTYVDDTPTTSAYVEPAGFAKGDWLVGFAGSYRRIGIESTDVDLLTALVEADYFVLDNLSVGASFVGLFADVDDLGDLTALGLEPHVRYYFSQLGSFTPYIGAHAGIGNVDVDLIGDTDVTTYGAHLGALVPMTESAYVDLQLKWTEWDVDELDSIDLDSLEFMIGIKVQL